MDSPNYNKVNAKDAINEHAKLNGMTPLQAKNDLFNYGFLEVTETVEVSNNSKGQLVRLIYPKKVGESYKVAKLLLSI